MKEVAEETEYSKGMTEWAERFHAAQQRKLGPSSQSTDHQKKEEQLLALYRKGVEESGVRIISGDRLGLHHQLANFWQENPFKILGALGVPTVLYIFKGRSEQNHLQLQSKLMHTRVYGQFAVLTIFFSLMGFKNYMDKNGKFITEAEAEFRVMEMKKMRTDLLEKLAYEKRIKEYRNTQLRKAKKNEMSGSVMAEKGNEINEKSSTTV